MPSLVIGIAGLIGSGKTSVAQSLANRLECPITSFGDYVRSVARGDGHQLNRSTLQRVSEELLASIGAEGLARNVLTAVRWDRQSSLVIEGVRHSAVVRALKAEVAPIGFTFIYLDVTPEIRQRRIGSRDNLSEAEISKIELHSTERDVASELRGLADIVISSDGQVDDVVAEIIDRLK